MRLVVHFVGLLLSAYPIVPIAMYTSYVVTDGIAEDPSEQAVALAVSGAAIFAALLVWSFLLCAARPEAGAAAPAVAGSWGRALGAASLVLLPFLVAYPLLIGARGMLGTAEGATRPIGWAVLALVVSAIVPYAFALRALWRFGRTPASYRVWLVRATVFGVLFIVVGLCGAAVTLAGVRGFVLPIALAACIGAMSGGAVTLRLAARRVRMK